jgi:hypothetical protein
MLLFVIMHVSHGHSFGLFYLNDKIDHELMKESLN